LPKWRGGCFLSWHWRPLCRRAAAARRRGDRQAIRAATLDALTVYLGGNHDLAPLKSLSAEHRCEVRETILQCQTSVGQRQDEFCELAVILGYVDDLCHEARSQNPAIRRAALSHLASLAHYSPVHRLIGNIPDGAFLDPDEEIRLQAARILLGTGEPEQIEHVFKSVLTDTARIRTLLASELGGHADELCKVAVPLALESEDPPYLVNLLRLLTTWERVLPFSELAVAKHSDPGVRAAAMRLLPFLLTSEANRSALNSGLADENPQVKDAAAAAIRKLGLNGMHAAGDRLFEAAGVYAC
jgi:hypothetical protein